MAREYPTLLDLVGETPIVRLDRIGRDVQPTLLAKLEYLNPGGSNKDRIGMAMIEAAEREGKLKPGGTIVEPTSGNTGVGLAIAAAVRGYRCIFVMPDKMSQEKIALLRAYGAEVVITPTAVEHDSPESYYSVSDRLAEEIPGGFKPDQYSNMSNPEAHYETTGPEIWEQTGGEIDAVVISVGTGGTISGAGRYLKEQNPDLLIVGADPEGSIYTSEEHASLPRRGDRQGHLAGDDVARRRRPLGARLGPRLVRDRAAAGARGGDPRRRLGRDDDLGGARGGEGPRAGGDDPDAPPRLRPLVPLEVLRRQLDAPVRLPRAARARADDRAGAALQARRGARGAGSGHDRVARRRSAQAIDLMQRYSISQLPVVRDGDAESLADVVGSLQERGVLDRVFKNPDALNEDVAALMQPPLATVDVGDSLDQVFADLSGPNAAVVVAAAGRPTAILTRSDLLDYLAHQRSQVNGG